MRLRRDWIALLASGLFTLGCGDDGRIVAHHETCSPANTECESAVAERVCAADGRSWSVNECAPGEVCVDATGCTAEGTMACEAGQTWGAPDGGALDGPDGGGADGGAPDIACRDQSTGTACGEGRVCIAGTCEVSRCGDGYVDQSAGEECEPGSNCSGDCRLLPCAAPAPCLVAERNASGDCISHAAADGTSCDDGDACTADDRCQGGVCVGTAVQRQASLRGEVQTFGASPAMTSWMEGLSAFMSADRLVFLESKSYTDSALHLVKVDSQGLTRLATATTETGYFYDINWVYRPETHIVPLTQTDFAVVDGHDASWPFPRNIELFEIDDDQLVSHGATQMPDDGPVAFCAAGRGDALWVGGPGELETYDFDAGSKRLKLAARLPLGFGEGCNALALSPDGNALFMATKGIRVIDVSGDPKPGATANTRVPEICPAGTVPRDPSATVPETCTVLPDLTLSDVQVDADYLAALSTDNVGDLGSALAVSTHDSNAVKTIEQDALPAAAPIGLGLAGNRLFVEWKGNATSDSWGTIDVALHPLDTASTKPLAQFPVRDDCCGAEPWTLLSFVAKENLAVLQPWRRVVRFDESSHELTFVTGTEHGSLKALVPSSATEVAAIGPYESHWIDVSQPDSPRIVSGGMNLSPASADFQLLTSDGGVSFSLANTPPGILQRLEQRSPRERFSILDVSLAPRAAELGAFWIDGEADGNTQIGASRGQVFQVRDTPDWSFRVRRYQASAGIGLDVEELAPDLEVVVGGTATPDFPVRGTGAFGVNDDGTELLILERHYSADFSVHVPVATWLAVGPNGISVLAQAEFDVLDGTQIQSTEVDAAQHIVLSGDQALVVDHKFVGRLRRMGSTIVQEAFQPMLDTPDSKNPIIERILAFDRRRAALSVHHWTATYESRYGVEIRDGTDLSMLATYDTSEEVQSMLVVGTELVFGMNSAVSVAAPYCR